MTSRDERPTLLAARRGRSAGARYFFAVATALLAVLVSVALLELSQDPNYSPLLGAVALTAWYGGIGPALVGCALGWGLGLLLLVEPRGSFGVDSTDDMARWAIGLLVAAVIIAFSAILRIGRQRATGAAVVAETSLERVRSLHELGSALSGAVSYSEVSRALAERAAALLGAQGATVGVLETADVLVVEPIGLTARFVVPGRRIGIDQATLLTRAVAEGRLVRADDRNALESSFPASAAMLPVVVQSAVAIPLRVGSEVIGVAEFLFDRPQAMNDELTAVALTAAGLAEQALERARLYERERQSRLALDRILRVAPRFHAESGDEVAEVICREARATFGTDYGVLWRLHGPELELLRSDPVREELPPGLRVPLADFSGLAEAVAALDVSFSPDVLLEAKGEGLERVRKMGIRSSFRSPIAIGGRAELVLAVSWRMVVSEPDPWTVAVMRRFADQAGLALEQLKRRRAEAEAANRAEDTKRLQEVTAALSLAATPGDVAGTCLEHALRAVGADAGFVVLTSEGRTAVELVSDSGYSDAELDGWRVLGLDADVPFARAIASGEPVWALTAEEMAVFTRATDFGDAGWATLPLKTGAGVRGALHLSFRTPRQLTPEERAWLQAAVGQCAQALERSRLLDDEQLRRARAERLQSLTSALSNALTSQDVAEAVVEALTDAFEPEAASVAVVEEDRAALRTLAWHGYPDELAQLDTPLDRDTPATRAVKGEAWRLYPGDELEDFEQLDNALETVGYASHLVVPLLSGRKRTGVLTMSWRVPMLLAPEDRTFVETLGGQAALALDRARVFESERTIAETLQRSVLPASLPRVEGVRLAARYLPGTQGVAVGGDWYDAIELSDGRLGLTVGDVMGKGVHAAASMGQLRNALRAFSVERLKPSSALARLDRLVEETLESAFATVVYAVVDPVKSLCRYSSAGHPPPLVAYPDGRVELLEEGRGLPLGSGMRPQYRQAAAELPAGSVLLLYTDGLIERRRRSIDDGLNDLVLAARESPKDPERFLEHVLDRLVGDAPRSDDIALLAVCLLPVAPQPLELRIPSTLDALGLVRNSLRAWLEGAPVGRADAESLVLAVWEASVNAVEHAVDPAGEGVLVRAVLEDSKVSVLVEDSGRWVPSVDRAGRGFGLQLMRALTSSVEIVPGGENGGTRVTIELEVAEATGSPTTAR